MKTDGDPECDPGEPMMTFGGHGEEEEVTEVAEGAGDLALILIPPSVKIGKKTKA